MPVSDYASYLRWLVPTITTNADTGQEKEVHDVHPEQPYLWASVEEQAGRRQTDVGAIQTGADAEIRIPGFPPITVKDLLQDEYTGYVWQIDSMYNDASELVIRAYRNDSLEDYEIVED